jgi:hypothetical protein
VIRRLSWGFSATLKTTMILALLGAAGAAFGAQPPDDSTSASAERARATLPATKAPDADSNRVGFHDLICKPNGTEDGFDCADEATPAKIVPIPSQSLGPRPQDVAVSG